MSGLQSLKDGVARYYGGRLARHGPTPLGVDWSCVPTQQLRFVQLLRVCDFTSSFSLNDVGCGYGALLQFIGQRHRGARVDYHGIDLAPEMIDEAQRLWGKRRRASFSVGDGPSRVADYSVASGVFNVRIDEPVPRWEKFIGQTLRDIAAGSGRAFAVNFLRELPAGMEGKPELYRTEPAKWAGFCTRELGTEVTVLDAYGMREFTLLARHAGPSGHAAAAAGTPSPP